MDDKTVTTSTHICVVTRKKHDFDWSECPHCKKKESKTTLPDSDGWKYFNTSNEEWEWSRERPQVCDGAKRIKPCSWREFHKEFPNAY